MTLQVFYLGTWVVMVTLTLMLSSLASLTLPVHLMLAGFAAYWALFGGWRHWRRYRPSPLGVTLVCGVLALVGIVLSLDTEDVVAGLSGSLWSVLPLFLFRGQRPYGHWLALFTVAALALISVMIREELLPFSLFLLFIVTLVLNLNATNLLELAGSQGARRYRLPGGYLRGLAPAFFWGAVTAGLIFFFFPRTGNWANPLSLRGQDSLTGYKGTVDLESATTIRESDRVEMQVVSEEKIWLAARLNSLYFRGNSVEVFDGSQWTPLEREWEPVFPNADLRYTRRHQSGNHHLEIFREQHVDQAVFYPGVLVSVRAPWRVTRGLLSDGTGNLKRFRKGNIRYSYKVQVVDPKPAPDLPWAELRRRAKSFPKENLQIPKSISTAPFWKAWKAELNPNSWKRKTTEEVLAEISQHFRENYAPTLIHEFPDALPLEGFLRDRRGHCEYFATATALLLRSQGIPARLVLGFRGGTYNDVSQTVEVRAKNAHAWLEFQSGLGQWTRYDPTPVIPYLSGKGLRDQWTLYAHAVAFWFNRYVVQYNMDTQRQLFQSFANLGRRRPQEPFSWGIFGRNVAVALLILGLLWGARRLLPLLGRSGEAMPAYYLEFLRWTAGKGFKRERGESLRQFHHRVAEGTGARKEVAQVDACIHRDRYGKNPSTPEQHAEVMRVVRSQAQA